MATLHIWKRSTFIDTGSSALKAPVLVSIAMTLVILTGCGATVHPTRTASGREGAAISCDGLLSTWKRCESAAAKACPRGFDVVDRQEKRIYVDTGSFKGRSLVVSCKP